MGMKELMVGSQLVFVGKVRSVKPSGITTSLAYPTWDGAVFEWLKVDVEVVEPLKGCRKGESVKVLMLSMRIGNPNDVAAIINPPGMVHPEVGQHHLLCLLPTKQAGSYASITGPFDDDQGIFLLDRGDWEYATYRKDPKHYDKFPLFGERYKAVWSLVDEQGAISREGAAALRRQYKAELADAPPKGSLIHLEWKLQASESGFRWNMPADFGEGESTRETSKPPVEAKPEPSPPPKRKTIRPRWRR